jgi:hypothetical protein
MTSNINPNNINGAYPVAGQDNNSQGFRDNFTNTSTNFQYAADEITELQNKAVLKAQLGSGGGVTVNNLLGSTLSNGILQDMSQAVNPLGTLSGTVIIDYSMGSYQTVTTGGSITLGFINWPAAGTCGQVTVQVTVSNTAHTLTFPTAVSINNEGTTGLYATTNVLTFPATGTYSFTFTTSNGGTTITLAEENKQLQPLNSSAETLSSGAASLSAATSYFSTTGPTTASLAAGVRGQTKVFVCTEHSGGDMVISVAGAGWKTSGAGNITFTATGQACTLQASYNKWYCIGNNGATFS